ncbi:MAG: TonB family protein [Acidobacteriota bacterium]
MTVEPIPLYQAQPTFKLSNEQKLVEPVSVDVKVQVAESGAVTDAEVVDYGDPPNFPLANSALAAARNWTFQPSRVDDIPVASQVVLHFYFSP